MHDAHSFMNALKIHPDDSIAILVKEIPAGDPIAVMGEGSNSVYAAQKIDYGHKIALRLIEAGEAVIKYGERIGIAMRPIAAGEHVHIHNVRGLTSEEREVTRNGTV